MATRLLYQNETTGESVEITDMWDEGHEFQQDLQDALTSLGSAYSNIIEVTGSRITVTLGKISDAEQSLKDALLEIIKVAEEEGFNKQTIADMIGISTTRLKTITKA